MAYKLRLGLSNNIFRSKFFRNVLTLSIGTTIAQSIQIAFTPILTRLYTPADFGLASLYVALVSILSVLVTGKYELAITLPEDDEDAANITTFTLKFLIIICGLFYIPIYFFGEKIAYIFGGDNLIPWLYLIPISVMVISAYNVLQYWLNRNNHYRAISINRIGNAFYISLLSVYLGVINKHGGMILGKTIGQVFSLLIIGRRIIALDRKLLSKTYFTREKKLASKYIKHLIYITPSSFIGVLAQQVPVFMISSLYPLAMTGYFSFAYQVVSLPTLLIARAIGDVYRQKIAVAYIQNGEFQKIFIKTLLATSISAIIPFIALYFLIPFLFIFAFGVEWGASGDYAQILIIATFFQFIITPLDKGSVVVGASKYILIWNVIRLLLNLALYIYSIYHLIPMLEILVALVIIDVFLYLIDGIMQYKFSKNKL